MPAYLVMWIHLLAVIAWIGGLLFFTLVLRPVLRALPDASQPAETLRRVGRRFRTVAWISLVTLILTGAGNILHEGGSARIATAWGAVLMLKLLLVAVAVGLTLVHDFILDPYRAPSPRSAAVSGLPADAGGAFWVERGILGLALGILLLAAYLAHMSP